MANYPSLTRNLSSSSKEINLQRSISIQVGFGIGRLDQHHTDAKSSHFVVQSLRQSLDGVPEAE